MRRILVTGAMGQIGSELTPALRERYGVDNVVAAGYKKALKKALKTAIKKELQAGPFCYIDARDPRALEKIIVKYRIDAVYHLAGILSAVAEKEPQEAWQINMTGLYNILDLARQHGCALFFPSSIGAFGPNTPAENTPQDTIQRPTTIYGITKLSGELLCDYYFRRFGVDARGLRYPGIISHKTPPGGGTTDYAVDIFRAALETKHYECFLKEGTRLDMMYMPDAVRAAIELMEIEPARLKHRNAFNVTAMSFAPEDIAAEIKKIIPDFTISYRVDPVRQSIAESWPRHMDDSAARREWGWNHQYDLAAMTRDMIEKLSA